tara:strand:+ start:3102 stop:4721 length:1620 start_codon:yes stop_codon:yes gene_type:complete
MIHNKTILLICKERRSLAMFHLGKELEKNNKVHYFFVHYTEVLNRNNYNKETFFYFKDKIKNENIHDVKDINVEFLKNRKNIKIDFNRLKEIEKKYTYFAGLNKQILSSQATSTAYHDRFYFNPTTYDQNLYWLLLNYNKTESLLEKIKPDCIFGLDDNGEIQKTIINEIANYKKIPFILIEHSRYKSIHIPIFSLGRNLDKYFVDAYNKNKNDNDCKKYIEDVQNYRAQSNIMPEIYKNQITSSYDVSFWETIKVILEKTYIFFKALFDLITNDKYGVGLNTPLYSNLLKRILIWYMYSFKKFYLYSRFNKYFSKPSDEKYLYMPLHKIPESSTYVAAPMYINEMNLIEAISKSMPISWKLYVKEHQSMIGERSFDFYKKIKKLHNVRLVKSNFYKDPKPWIEKSLCVITITGTTGFEASMLNKPVIVLGNILYRAIPSVKVAKNFNELEALFKEIENNDGSYDNIRDCATYLKTINEFGISIDLNYLMLLSWKKIQPQSLDGVEEKDLNSMLKNLMIFYEKALIAYNNTENKNKREI